MSSKEHALQVMQTVEKRIKDDFAAVTTFGHTQVPSEDALVVLDALVVVAAPSPLSISRPPSSLYRCLSLSLASGARAGLCQDPNSDSLRACKNGAV